MVKIVEESGPVAVQEEAAVEEPTVESPAEVPAGQPVIRQAPAQEGPRIVEEDPPDRGIFQAVGEEALGGLEFLTTLLTGAGSAIFSGFGGTAKTITSGPEAGQDVIERIQEGLTFVPRSKAGLRNVEKTGQFFSDAAQFAKENNIPIITPLVEIFSEEDNLIGNFAADQFKQFGSPALEGFAGAFGATLPHAFLEALGFRGAGNLSKRIGAKKGKKFNDELKKFTSEAALPSNKLFTTADKVFKEVTDLGATVKVGAYDRLVKDIAAGLKKRGFRRRIDPEVASLLDEFIENQGKQLSLEDVTDLRTVAEGFASSADKKTQAMGMSIIDNIDNMLDSKGVLNIPEGVDINVGKRFEVARKMWGQGRRSQKIEQLIELAENNRASFLQGVQTEFKQLIRQGIRGKGDGKFFSKEDRRLMQEVVEADNTTNIAKNLAKLQITRAGGGSLIPLMGPSGALISGIFTGELATGGLITAGSVALGEVANSLAVKMTKSNLKMADGLIRAGADGRKIARAYFENVPKNQRSVDELAMLLSDPSIDVSKLPKSKFTAKAIEKANDMRQKKIFLGSQGVFAQNAKPPEDEPNSSRTPFSGLAEFISQF